MWKLIFISIIAFNGKYLSQEVDTIIKSSDGFSYYKGKLSGEKKIGTWLKYDLRDSPLDMIEMFDDGKKCKITPSNPVKNDTSYSFGLFIGTDIILNGQYQHVNPRNNSILTGNFKFGKRQGQWVYSENGVVRIIEYYYEQTITITNYSEQGKTINFSTINETGLPNGLLIEYDENQNLKSIGNYQNGTKIGEWSYYINGIIQSRGHYYPDYLTLKGDDTLILVNKEGIKAEILYSKKVLDSYVINDQILFLKDGNWKYYNNIGQPIKNELYEKGELKKVKKLKYYQFCRTHNSTYHPPLVSLKNTSNNFSAGRKLTLPLY